MNLNHNESLLTAIYYEDCLDLADYLSQISPELWGRLERGVPTGGSAATRTYKGSPRTAGLDCTGPAGKHQGWRLSQPAASFGGEADGRLQRTDSDTTLKSAGLQENIRHCGPAPLFSLCLHLAIWQYLYNPLFVIQAFCLPTSVQGQRLQCWDLFHFCQDLDKIDDAYASLQSSLQIFAWWSVPKRWSSFAEHQWGNLQSAKCCHLLAWFPCSWCKNGNATLIIGALITKLFHLLILTPG